MVTDMKVLSCAGERYSRPHQKIKTYLRPFMGSGPRSSTLMEPAPGSTLHASISYNCLLSIVLQPDLSRGNLFFVWQFVWVFPLHPQKFAELIHLPYFLGHFLSRGAFLMTEQHFVRGPRQQSYHTPSLTLDPLLPDASRTISQFE